MGVLQNQLPTISELRQIVQFCTKTETDVDGFPKTGIVASGTDVRAKVRYLSTNEAQGENQEKFTTEIKVWVRFKSSYSVYQYLLYEGSYYDIFAKEATPANRFNVLKARLIET